MRQLVLDLSKRVKPRRFVVLGCVMCYITLSMVNLWQYSERAADMHRKGSFLFLHEWRVATEGPRRQVLLEGTTNGSNSDSVESCWSLNSESWLKGPRHGNDRDSNFTLQDITQQILGSATVLASTDLLKQWLGQTLCYYNSPFVTGVENDPHKTNYNQEREIRLWAVRLVYLSIHYHQHRYAIPEAQVRLHNADELRTSPVTATTPAVDCIEPLSARYNVGLLDYECPAAKYLVIHLTPSGLGSNVRVGAALALMLGLALNRVVLFINHSPHGPNNIRMPWDLAACHRRDHQCFFLPMTPCVVTYHDLTTAYKLTDPETFQLVETQRLPPGHDNDKVIITTWLRWAPKRAVTLAQIALYSYSSMLIGTLPRQDPRLLLLRQAASTLLREDKVRSGYDFPGATSRILHALEFYSIRPNHRTATRMDEIMREIASSPMVQAQLRTKQMGMLGLPIRGSDKCGFESDCLDLSQTLKMASYVWDQHLTTIEANDKWAPITAIFTTESRSILDDQIRFLANNTWQRQFPYQFRFVTNPRDIKPGTGMIRNKKGINVSEAMISSLSTFRLQLLAQVTMGNCCSNYHQLLSDYFMEGCGAMPDHTFSCIQEYNNSAAEPDMLICCYYDTECYLRKAAYRAALPTRELKQSPP